VLSFLREHPPRRCGGGRSRRQHIPHPICHAHYRPLTLKWQPGWHVSSSHPILEAENGGFSSIRIRTAHKKNNRIAIEPRQTHPPIFFSLPRIVGIFPKWSSCSTPTGTGLEGNALMRRTIATLCCIRTMDIRGENEQSSACEGVGRMER
jgi:hypothetical protein